MDETPVVPGLPTARSCPFDPPAELLAVQAERPITRMSFPDGQLGWLVTTDSLAREVLTRPEFSARHELRSHPIPMPLRLGPAAPGMFIGMDPPEHSRYRRPLSRTFTVRNVRRLEPKIEQIVAERLDAMERTGPPCDLVAEFALPVPVRVISELLGADLETGRELQRLRTVALDPESPPDRAAAASGATNTLVGELVRGKRTAPADDLLSALMADADLDDKELTGIAMLLLIAGHETTSSMLALSTYLLLTDEKARSALSGGPLTEAAVNELLRYLSVVQFVSRAALTDVEIGGELIRAGETVTLSLPSVNRDGGRFTDPSAFGPEGSENGHLAFGHGLHQCIGHNLARAEIRIAMTALLARFPRLALADPSTPPPTREAMNTFGLDVLPVTW